MEKKIIGTCGPITLEQKFSRVNIQHKSEKPVKPGQPVIVDTIVQIVFNNSGEAKDFEPGADYEIIIRKKKK